MNPCIGDVYEVTMGGRQNIVIVTNVTNASHQHPTGYWECDIAFLVLKGNGEGQTGAVLLDRRAWSRWRKVTD